MTPAPEDTPAGVPRMLSGRGLNAAGEIHPSPSAVNARDAAFAPRIGGISGNPERTGGAVILPVASPVQDPAPGISPVAGVEGGQVEPPSQAPVRAREAAPCGDPGSSSRGVAHEGNAAAGTRPPAAAQASPPLIRESGGARREPGTPCGPGSGFSPESASSPALQGHAGEAKNPAGGARADAAPPAAGLSGKAFRDAVRAAEVAAARTRRTGRGKRAARAGGSRYVPGANRRRPPDGAS